jgi:hypothetical protein
MERRHASILGPTVAGNGGGSADLARNYPAARVATVPQQLIAGFREVEQHKIFYVAAEPDLFFLKKSCKSAEHSSARTPETTSILWFSCG